MEVETKNIINKLSWILRVIDTAYLFRNENVNDFSKRVILRIIFVQVDNFLKIIGNIKNRLYREGFITQLEKKEIEENIKELTKSYDGSFDVVRDKLTAHGQPVDLVDLIELWMQIDYSTIEIIYQDIKTIQSNLDKIRDVNLLTIPDYLPLSIPTTSSFSKSNNKVKMSSDRFGLAKANTIAMISCHETQEKAQIILSIINFLEIDFELTKILDNPKSIFENMLFDIGWILVFVDLISLIDNLFEDVDYDKSLLSYWKNDMKGYNHLKSICEQRDLVFESKIRRIRNKFSAHIDSFESIESLYKEFYEIDLKSISLYTVFLVNGFFDACRKDIRTGTFLINNKEILGYKNIEVATNVKPFDD